MKDKIEYKKIRSYKDLLVWQQGHQLVLKVYGSTKKFPKEEQYSLTSQLRRSVVSVTSNIAEGFGRLSLKEKAQFYYLSLGSLAEVDNQLTIAKDVGYLDESMYSELEERITSVRKLLSRLTSSTKDRIEK